MSECTAVVYCEICKSTDHASIRCPILKQPKPVAHLVGQAADPLASFYIPHAPIQPAKKDSRLALVSTIGKNLTEEELVAYLKVLVSDTFAWEVKRQNDSEFKVTFPSKADLTKMTKFNAEMKEGVTLKFEEFKEQEEYFGHVLPVVWMRVTNLPSILREYIILWALGTLFGVTQEVDMITTRASNFGRFAVAVLEPEAIPKKLDVIIGNRYFQLTFEVEPFSPNIGLWNRTCTQGKGIKDHGLGTAKDTEMKEADNTAFSFPSEANMENKDASHDGGNGIQEAQLMDEFSNDDLLDEENKLTDAAYTFLGVQKGNAVDMRNAAALAASAPARLSARPSGVNAAALPQKISQPSRADKAKVLASETMLDTEQGTKVLHTQVAATSSKKSKLGMSTMSATRNVALETTTLSQSSAMMDVEQVQVSLGHLDELTEGDAHHVDSVALLKAGVVADGETKTDLGSVMKMAILSDGELTPVQRSKRNVMIADVDSFERAERRVAVKNMEEPQGNIDVHSFCSFSNVHIEENLGGVGISLGSSNKLIHGSISLIKNIEEQRLKVPKHVNKLESDCDHDEDEIDPDTSTISRLCGDLTEEVMDDSVADPDGVLVNVPIRVAKNKKKFKFLNKVTAKKKNTKLFS
jgi:hypothetical protein